MRLSSLILILIAMFIIFVLISCSGTIVHGHTPNNLFPLYTAICKVETNGGKVKTDGDNGDSIGDFQIKYGYWLDSKTPGKYTECRDHDYVELVMFNYWRRYCPKALNARNY